ncbi:hypothetical protein GCM10010468_12220 [Actinocorallia longicatena]|uniref:N-acetyltransferase domain-containing protein n=1 Tax=Actinocorallia longicatena TaxID=111803 RepID=A0ABP6Q183_9ACTN
MRGLHRQTGCGPFGDITADFEPAAEFAFVNRASEAEVPAAYAEFAGLRFRAEMAGIAARAVLVGGRFHEVDSSRRGCELAVRAAVRRLRADLGLPRVAVPGDVPELVRLRRVLLTAMNGGPITSGWESAYAAVLERRIGTEGFVAFVLDGAQGLAAAGIGTITEGLPSPSNPAGINGTLLGMATDPRERRRGHARRIVEALMVWFRAEGAARIDLNATTEGEGLYRSFGFTPPPFPALTWRRVTS